ncbi:MAG: hypothetical protein WCA28_18600, partial [Bradyrhizobium sp.]
FCAPSSQNPAISKPPLSQILTHAQWLRNCSRTTTKLASLITDNYVLFLLFGSISGFLLLFYPGATYATIQSLAKPNARSFASAVTMFCINGVGIAGGAFLTGWLSDRLVPVFGADSLRWSLGILSLLSVWSAVHYWRASYHLGRRATK